jgi:hypothetical protein
MTGKKPYKVTFIAHENGLVNAFRNAGKAEDFGNVNNSDAVKVRNYLRKIVLEVGAS